jgi:hypothetical protein
MKLRKSTTIKLALGAALALGSALAAAGPFFRTGTVTTTRNGADISVRMDGDAAADLFDQLSLTVPATRVQTEDGRIVDVLEGDNVTCAHQLRQRLGILRPARELWVCQIEVGSHGQSFGTAAAIISKIIGVEN